MVKNASHSGVLIGLPKFTGCDHFCQLSSRRFVIQMSLSPSPPGRSLLKYIVTPSDAIYGVISLLIGRLIILPRLFGSVQQHSSFRKLTKRSLTGLPSSGDIYNNNV